MVRMHQSVHYRLAQQPCTAESSLRCSSRSSWKGIFKSPDKRCITRT